MLQFIRGLAALGVLWTFYLILFMLVLTRNHFGFGLTWVVFVAAQLLVFVRLYNLKRWAMLAACGYCWWMTAGSLSSGIWQWSLGWLLLALLITLLCALNWASLEPGF